MKYTALYNLMAAYCDKGGVSCPTLLITRNRNSYGRADEKRNGYKVTISRHCFERGYTFTRNTLLHEIAHIIQWHLYPESSDHGPVFRAICYNLDPMNWRSIAKEER